MQQIPKLTRLRCKLSVLKSLIRAFATKIPQLCLHVLIKYSHHETQIVGIGWHVFAHFSDFVSNICTKRFVVCVQLIYGALHTLQSTLIDVKRRGNVNVQHAVRKSHLSIEDRTVLRSPRCNIGINRTPDEF